MKAMTTELEKMLNALLNTETISLGDAKQALQASDNLSVALTSIIAVTLVEHGQSKEALQLVQHSLRAQETSIRLSIIKTCQIRGIENPWDSQEESHNQKLARELKEQIEREERENQQ